MSSSQGDKKDSDVEMGDATSPAPVLTSPAEAPACVAGHLSFREELVRRQAEKELAQADSEFPSSSAQVVASCHGTEVMALLPQALPAGSSTTLILVENKEKAADSMPPPPSRKDVVLALRAPSAVLATQPKSRKRKLAKSGDGENSQRGGSILASGLRGKSPFRGVGGASGQMVRNRGHVDGCQGLSLCESVEARGYDRRA
ncbi:hypothetical protein Bca4012_100819 [Brassica carinata]